MATKWLVSNQTGSDANGGTSIAVRSTGTDGIANSAAGLTKFTSISATWGAGDVGHAIRASSGTLTRLITAVQAAQSIATAVTASGLTTFTSAGLFNATMLGCAVSGPGIAAGTYISAYTSSSSMTLSAAAGAGFGSGPATIGPLLTTTGTTSFTAATGQTWTVGGMKATLNQAMVTASGIKNAYSTGDSIYVGAGIYRETVATALSGAVTASGTHGVTSTSGTTFTDSTAAAFTSGMVGENIEIVAGGSTYLCLITAYTSTSVVTIAPATAMGFPPTAFSSCSWQVGKVAVIGDVDGYETGQAGQVIPTAYTTNDSSVPSSSILLALAATTNLSFSLLTLVAGSVNLATSTAAAAAANYTFIDCGFNTLAGAGSALSLVSSTTGLALGVTVDRCVVLCGNANAISVSAATTASGSADYDLLSVVRNSLIISSSVGVRLSTTGTNTFSPGGLRVYGSTIVASTGIFTATALHISTTIPCEAHNNLIIANTGISAATAGQITGSYNVIYAATPETNYTYGTGDVSNSAGTGTYKAPLLELGQSWKWAGVIRQFLAPDGATSPLLGAGSATLTGNYPNADWANRNRPSGGGSANPSVGYAEFHDASVQDTVNYPTGQTSSAKMTGPGDTDIWVPVDAVSTTIAIQLRQGSGYTGTTYATATIEAQGELGVVTQIVTCSSTLSAWQTLTFSAITASKAGWVKVRISSYDTSGTGTLNFGALTAT
jgi:hypothetical protein